MTKFEEEFEHELDYFIERELSLDEKLSFGARDVLVKFFSGWHSPEHIEKEIQMKLLKLQQQALPVVKDFVAEWYEGHKDDLDFSIFEACVNLHDDCSSDFEKWFGNSENKSIETLIRMKNGYTVEKPQLFYLKHIDMSKADKECDYFAQIRNDRFEHESVQNNTLPGVEVVGVRFTQAEIDSMQIGSYEQIPVPVEDGE